MDKTAAQRKMKFELTFMNIFCAMLVIFIHCASVLIGETSKADKVFNLIFTPWRFSTFVVPAFIFLSGIKLFLSAKKINYPKFYFRRFTRVILPYVLWVVVFYIFFLEHEYFDFSWGELWHYIWRGDLVGHFYFVIIIVQFYILMPLWSYGLRRINPGIGIVFATLVSMVLGYNLLNILNVFYPGVEFGFGDVIFTKYLLYWVCGCYVGMNYESFKEAVLKNKLVITFMFLLFGALDIYLAYLTYDMTVLWMEDVHVMYCAAAILFFFMLFSWICTKKKKLTWFTRALDSQCYNIYLSHCLIILFLNDYLLVEKGMIDVVQRFWRIIGPTYGVSIAFWMLWQGIKTGTIKLFGVTKSSVQRIKDKAKTSEDTSDNSDL